MASPENQVAKAQGTTVVAAPKKPASKPRIDCIDGCRFALVLPIVIAHFARFSTKNHTILKILLQENILVGGFFVISGYVAGYTSTVLGERKAEEKKLANPELFFWQKVMGYYPLHFLMLLLFTPMFVWTERQFKTPWTTTAFRGFLSYSMMQAWFPNEGEIWNQPTWFLSALTFSNFTMPTIVLPNVAKMSKEGLKKLFIALTSLSVLQKMSYSEATRFHSRMIETQAPMNPLLWNLTRFHPFWALNEMTMGVVDARAVMLDTEEDRKKKHTNPAVWFALAYGTLLLRITRFDFNDAIVRSVLFVPLYTKFLSSMHRDLVSGNPSALTDFFGSKLMTYLGGLAFPMFIVHGPIGQIFYKKAVAKKLFGGVMPNSFFPVYLAICLAVSHLLNEYFVKNKAIAKMSGALAQFLADRTQGMLKERAIDDARKA